MDKVNIGLIGCGGRLRDLIRHMPKIGEGAIKVLAVYDPDKNAIEALNSQLGYEPDVYDDYHDVINRPDISWIMDGSWNKFHCEHVVAAFNAGKNVFCEKPLATTIEDCVAMKEAYEKSGKTFIMGFTLRYSPHYRRIREIVESGEIGDIISMEFNETLDFNHGGMIMANWRRHTHNAGTHLLEKCSHDIDIANGMVAAKARYAASFGGINFFKPENAHYMDDIPPSKEGKKPFCSWMENPEISPFNDDKDIIDNQIAIIEYENGVKTTFHTNCCAGIPERRMYICATEGGIRGEVREGILEIKKIGFDEPLKDIATGVKGDHGGGDDFLGPSIENAMLDGTASETPLEYGFMSAITCFGIDEAMKTKKVVDMKKYWDKVGM